MRAFHSLLALTLLGSGLLADSCPGEEPDVPPDDLCIRAASPEDAPRYLVVSKPYSSSGGQADAWEVLAVTEDGSLERGASFTMGRAVAGEVAFTPDGQVGIAPLDDGSLGVFTLGEDGTPQVIHSRFEGDFYASQVLIHPDGDRAYIVDGNWRDNGGGIYGIWLHCDGHVSERGLLQPGKLIYQMRAIPGSPKDAFLAARDFSDAPTEYDGYRITLDDAPDWILGGDNFGDEDGIFSAAAITSDGVYAVVGDNSFFSGAGNRLGVMSLQDGTSPQMIENIEDPVALAFSPFGGSGLVVSGFGDAILGISYDANSRTPFTVNGPLSYTGSRPELPGDLAMIQRGALTGQVYIVENTAIRRVLFTPSGGVMDLGASDLGAGYEAIPGAIGVQP